MGMYEVGAALHLGAGRFGMFLDLRNRAIADMVQDGNVASTDGFRTSVGIEYRRR